MTIKELYDWAIAHNMEDAHLGIDIESHQTIAGEYGDEEVDFEYVEPVSEHDFDIGCLFDNVEGKWTNLGKCLWLSPDFD